jgi:NAD(P)H-hydrate epimerase
LEHIGRIEQDPTPAAPLVLAVDGPSGLDFDSGELDEAVLPADITVTFAYPKRGHFRFPGAASLGELVVADIGIDPALAAEITLETLTHAEARCLLPARPANGHKGTFGKALIIAGSANFAGAARLAGSAAVRSGAGLVTLALPSSIHAAVVAGLVEATYVLLPHEMGVISEPAVDVLTDRIGEYDALLIGPGLGQERETAAFVETLLAGKRERRSVGFVGPGEQASSPADLPSLVVDADGLNILSRLEGWPSLIPANSVLTPHPGEMARLTGRPVAEIQADRVTAASEHAQTWGHVVILKGPYTIVAAPDGRVVLQPFANPGLATGGTGDVLAGMIAALLAQGLQPFEAAVLGSYVHALAGELAGAKLGKVGMAAGDLARFLPKAWQALEES